MIVLAGDFAHRVRHRPLVADDARVDVSRGSLALEAERNRGASHDVDLPRDALLPELRVQLGGLACPRADGDAAGSGKGCLAAPLVANPLGRPRPFYGEDSCRGAPGGTGWRRMG